MRAGFRERQGPIENIMLKGQISGAGLETCSRVLPLPVTCSVMFSQRFCFQKKRVMLLPSFLGHLELGVF